MSEEEIDQIAEQLCNDPEFIEMVQERVEQSVDWKEEVGIAAIFLAFGIGLAAVLWVLRH